MMRAAKQAKTLTLLFCFAFALSLALPAAANAAWWKFGKASDEPEVTELRINSVDAGGVEERLNLGVDDLQNGRVVVRGRARVDKGAIGKVEVSLDGGEKWQKASLGDRGMFSFEFTPDREKAYDFSVRVLTTTGKKNDVEDSSFELLVSSVRNEDAVKKAFFELLKLYMNEDRAGFMARVSQDFDGDRSALDDALTDDFRVFDNIRIQAFITRVVEFDNKFSVYFTFNRQVLSTRTGKLLKDNLASTAEFSRDGKGFSLYGLANPLIFGVTDPVNVASSEFITEEAVGRAAITVDRDGQVVEKTLGSIVSDAPDSDSSASGGSGAEEGDATLVYRAWNDMDGFVFADDAVVLCDQAPDFCMEINMVFTDAGVMIQDLGVKSLGEVKEVPAAGYLNDLPGVAQAGHVYAFRIGGGTYHYAIARFSEVGTELAPGGPYRSVFEYKYQPTADNRAF